MNDSTTSTSTAKSMVTESEPDLVSTAEQTQAVAKLSFWETLSFTLAHTFLSMLLMLFSIRGLYWIGRWFGTLEWMINFKKRRRYARVLKHVLDDTSSASQRRYWTREYFMRSRCDKMFYLIFDRIPREKALSLFTIGNQEMLDQALSRGHGVHLAMSHHGPHHVAGMLMALSGYPVSAVRDRNEGGLRRFVQNRFDRLYPEFRRMKVLFADSYPREIYRFLKDGNIVGSAMDVSRVRKVHQKSEEMVVFGEKRPFMSGPLHIAYRCKATALQAFILPRSGFRYHFDIVETLIDPETTLDENAAVHQAMVKYAKNIEKYLRQTPSLITRL